MNLSQVSSLGPLALTWATEFLPRLITAIIILVVGYYVATWAAAGVRRLHRHGRRIPTRPWCRSFPRWCATAS